MDILLSERLKSLLNLILAIPPIHPTRYLQIAFLFRFTSSVREWIAGYPLQWPGGYASSLGTGSGSKSEEHAQATITLLLDFLQKLDDGWRRVLLAQTAVGDPETPTLSRGSAVPSLSITITEKYGESCGYAQIGLELTVRYLYRIRLRSSIISIRQTLLRWVERYRKQAAESGFPPRPPSGRDRHPSLLGDQPLETKLEPSDESDAGKSPGIVEVTMLDSETSDGSRAVVDEEALGDWEIAIANSMSRTLELVI